MKNILLTLGLMSIGTLAFAQSASVNSQPAPSAPQYAATSVAAIVAVPQTPIKPVPPVIPSSNSVLAVALPPEIPEVPEYAGWNADGDASEEGLIKTFSKTFPAAASDIISMNNQYGSITIKIWDRKEVKADVTISAYSNNADEQQKLLDGTRVLADKSGDQIAFRTEMSGNRNGNWGNGTRNGKKWRREVRVNYTLYVPGNNDLNISQQYGNVEIGNYAGAVNAKVQYGNFSAQKLSSSSNNLNVQYGKMTIQDLNKGNLKQQYGGGITLGSARDINISAQYATVRIDRLLGDAALSIQYNKVNIAQVAESSKVLTINAQYAGVDVGFSDSYKGSMDVKISYASFNFGKGVSAKIEGGEDAHGSVTKRYTGNIGGGGSSQVRVNASYEDVTFR